MTSNALHYRSRSAILLFAVTLSGAASLMYQVAWTRRLITVTSATATSQALVLAIFMAGLGVGALLGGRLSVRLRRPILGYASVEVAAAALALLSPTAVDWSERVRDGIGPLAQLAFIAFYFLIITTLLGMSLPCAIETIIGSDESPKTRGRIVSSLYGLNTLGAAGGCLLAGFVTIEHVGLSATSAWGAALATGAGLVSLLTVRKREIVVSWSQVPSVESRFMLAAFVSGAAGLGAEVVWTRLFSLIVPNTVYALSQVLFAVLLGIALGAAISNYVARTISATDDPQNTALRVAGLVASLGAVLLGLIPFVLSGLASSRTAQKELAAGRATLSMLALLALLVLTSAFVAAILPLLVMASHSIKGSRVFAGLYAANTLGAVIGSLGVGFVLLPAWGTRMTGLVLMMLLIGLALTMLTREARSRRVVVAAFVACLLLHFSHNVPRQLYEARIGPETQILEFREGIESNVMVTQDATMRKLWIGSIWVAGTGGPHDAFGHIPGLMVAEPKRVLGIALGTGQTFAAVFKHGVQDFDCVEIDANVVALSRKWFGEANGGLLDDPRVTTHIADGRSFMRSTDAKYDMIVLEPLQSWTAGTTNLYTREFYEEAQRLLNPGGVVAQWIPFYGQAAKETRAMVRTGLDVFPNATLWLVQSDGVIVYSDTLPSLSPSTIDKRIDERGIATDLQKFPARSAEDLLNYMMLGPRGLRDWTAGSELIVDDRPFLEFRAARAIGSPQKFRKILDSLRPHIDNIADYVSGLSAEEEEQVKRVDLMRHIRFELSLVPMNQHEERVTKLEAIGPDAAKSAHWRAMYRQEIFAWYRSLASHDSKAAEAVLERGRAREPALFPASTPPKALPVP